MKTFIVLAGLMVIVPRTDDNGVWRELNVLVLDPSVVEQSFPNDPMHQHYPKVTSFGSKDHFDLSGEWTIRSSSTPGIELRQSDRLLFLSHLYDPPVLPPLRGECRGPGAVTTCTSNGKPLLKAQLTLTGGWRIRPIEITHDREPRVDVLDDSTWGFMRFVDEDSLPRATRHQVQLSSGLVLESTGNAVTINGPNSALFPAELNKETCAVFAGHADSCGVVRFLNSGVVMDADEPDRVEIEHVQDAIYTLFNPTIVPIPHYLLFLRKTGSPEVMDILYPGGGGTITPERPCSPVIFVPAER